MKKRKKRKRNDIAYFFKQTTKHILLINEIDEVLNLDIDCYYQTIIIKELIREWRKPEKED